MGEASTGCDDQYLEKHFDLIGAAPLLQTDENPQFYCGLIKLGEGVWCWLWLTYVHMGEASTGCDDQYLETHFDLIGAAPLLQAVEKPRFYCGLIKLEGWCWCWL